MTSQGSPYQRFRRALATGNPLLAWAACAELPRVEPHDALALVLLLARPRDANFSRACTRWVSLYVVLTRCDAAEADLLRASLAALAGEPVARSAGGQVLQVLLGQHGLDRCLHVLAEAA